MPPGCCSFPEQYRIPIPAALEVWKSGGLDGADSVMRFGLDNPTIAAIIQTPERRGSGANQSDSEMRQTMKKRTMLCFACIGMMLLSACSNNPEDSVDSAGTQSQEEADQAAGSDAPQADAGSDKAAPDEEYEYPSEDAGPVQEESRLGYTMMYDPTVFTLDDTGEDRDVYTYHTAETLDGQAYFAVQAYPDMDAQTLADGVALQSGQDGVTPQETYFGADNLDTQCVSYQEEVDGVTQAYAFYAVPKGEGSLLVEITGYLDMPMQIQAKFEDMAGTFALLS